MKKVVLNNIHLIDAAVMAISKRFLIKAAPIMIAAVFPNIILAM